MSISLMIADYVPQADVNTKVRVEGLEGGLLVTARCDDTSYGELIEFTGDHNVEWNPVREAIVRAIKSVQP